MIELLQSDTERNRTGLDYAREIPARVWEQLLFVQEDANMAVAVSAPHIRDASKSLGRPLLIKIVCAVLKMASMSMNLSQPLSPHQVLEAAQLFLDKYPTDSVMDLVMCLKLLKSGSLVDENGKIVRVYNRFDVETVMEWMAAYGHMKAQWLENEKRKEASQHKTAINGLFLNADELSAEALAVVSSVKKSLLKPTPALQTFSDSDYFATLEHQLPTMPEESVRELLAESRRKSERVVEQMAQNELARRRNQPQTINLPDAPGGASKWV